MPTEVFLDHTCNLPTLENDVKNNFKSCWLKEQDNRDFLFGVIYPLDIPKLIAAAEACSGIHDYSSFTTPKKHGDDYKPSPIKLLNIGVKRGQPFTYPLNAIGHDTTRHLEFWDIHVRARSFVYKQIRRLVGGMVLVARNRISLDELKDILDNPRVNFPFAGEMPMSESGLFLLDVRYDPQDLTFDESSNDVPSFVEKDEDAASSSEKEEDNISVLSGVDCASVENNINESILCMKGEERLIQKELSQLKS